MTPFVSHLPRAPKRPQAGASSQLVAEMRAGSRAARTLLVETYTPYLRHVLGRHVGRDSELSDLLHDVFVAAFAGIDRLERPEALPGFLTQIAVNIARMHVRDRIQRRALVERLTFSVTGQRAHLDHVASEASAVAHELVEYLPQTQLVPLTLRAVESMKLSEVAVACRVSIPTVKRRLAAARRRFTRLASAVNTPLPA